MNDKNKIVVLGLGYVGLPLAIAFEKISYIWIWYFKKQDRSYKLNCDPNGEVSSSEFQNLNFWVFQMMKK